MFKSVSLHLAIIPFLFLILGCSDSSPEATTLPATLTNVNDISVAEGVETPSISAVPSNQSIVEPSEDLDVSPSNPVLLESDAVINNINPAQASTANTVSYVVKWGETLFSIARLCNTTVEAIMAANPEITSPELIYAGQTLQIPTEDPSPPNEPPQGTLTLTATPQSSTVITLQWNDIAGEDGYHVYIRLSGAEDWQQLGAVAANSIGVPIFDLQAGTTYQFYIEAFNSWGTNQSSEVTATTEPDPGGDPPEGTLTLTATPQSSTVINLQWNDTAGEDGYRVYMRLSGATDWQLLGALPANQTSEPIEGLQAGTTYQFFVEAFNSWGTNQSNETTATTEPDPGGEPPEGTLTLTATPQSSTVINLQWNDIAGEDGYHVFMGVSGTPGFWKLGTLPADLTSEPITALQSGTEYKFYIQAFNDAGNLESNVATVSTLPLPGGVLKIINETNYDLIDIRINGQQQLANTYLIPSESGEVSLAPGTYSLYVGIGFGFNNEELWNYTSTSITIFEGQTTLYPVNVTLGQLLEGQWNGMDIGGTIGYVCSPIWHALTFTQAGEFIRYTNNNNNCQLSQIENGSIQITNWANYATMVSFTLNNTTNCSYFLNGILICQIAIGGLPQELTKQ